LFSKHHLISEHTNPEILPDSTGITFINSKNLSTLNKMKSVITLQNGKKLSQGEFCQYFERKIHKTIRKFNLISNDDKIAVACSGGKDSTAVLYVLAKMCNERHQKVEALAIDEGMNDDYRKKLISELKKFCDKNKIKLHAISFKKEYGFTLKQISGKIKKLGLSNCYVCSILKRWLMNKKARKLGYTVIATGHNLDDEAETIILNQFKGNPALLAKLGPSSGIGKRKEFVQRIKPLYFCSVNEIVLYAKIKKLPLALGSCIMRGETFRITIRNFLKKMEKQHPEVKNAIVNSFLEILPMLKEKYTSEATLKKCKRCKEAASQELCKRCQILEMLKKR